MTAQETPPAGRFHAARPNDLRRPNRRHRLAHIIVALPAGLADLASHLDVPADGTVLDYGCADQPYRHLVPSTARYLGADLEGNPLADVIIRPDGTVPLEDESVDAILSTQVLEHVEDPATYLRECARVLRPGGRMLLSTHGIMVYHPDPVDLWRWTGAGLRRAVTDAGFALERFEGIMGLAATGFQLVQDALYWRLPAPVRGVFAFVMQALVTLADRIDNPGARRNNALVYALIARKPPVPALQQLLSAFADVSDDAIFVEIGANDGEQHDHLRPFVLEHGWRGAMVEPVPYVFERLSRNYEGLDGVQLVNAVVAPQDGEVPFYHLVDASDDERRTLPDWYDGIGSLSREMVLAHAKHMPDIEDRIVTRPVEALTFESLCTRCGLDRVDVVVIDTEGHDWEILRHIDLAARRPKIVIYEHFHLSRADRTAAGLHLRDAGYLVMEEGFDTIALDAGADPRLLSAWHGLKPAWRGVSVEDER